MYICVYIYIYIYIGALRRAAHGDCSPSIEEEKEGEPVLDAVLRGGGDGGEAKANTEEEEEEEHEKEKEKEKERISEEREAEEEEEEEKREPEQQEEEEEEQQQREEAASGTAGSRGDAAVWALRVQDRVSTEVTFGPGALSTFPLAYLQATTHIL